MPREGERIVHQREGHRIETVGVNYSGRIQVLAERAEGRFQLWKKASGKYWSGLGQPWGSSPVWYALVEVTRDPEGKRYDVARVLEYREPGAGWRAAVRELEQELENAAQDAAAGCWKEGGEA